MPFPVAAAIAAGSALAGQGMQMAATSVKNKKQFARTKELMDKQDSMQRSMAMFNNANQLQMWKDTGPQGQMKELQGAGLNAGLIYGMGGAGGQTAAASGGTGPSMGDASMENPGAGLGSMGMMLGQQLALMGAQKENIEADTELKLADATKKSGVDTEVGKTQVQNMLQGIESEKAKQRLTELQGDMQELQNKIVDMTAEDAMDEIRFNAKRVEQETNRLKLSNEITDRTKETVITRAKAELAGIGIMNLLNKQLRAESQQNVSESKTKQEGIRQGIEESKGRTSLMSEQSRQITHAIRQGWDGVYVNMQNGNTAAAKQQWDELMNDVPESQRINYEMVEKFMLGAGLMKMGTAGPNPVQGFRRY